MKKIILIISILIVLSSCDEQDDPQIYQYSEIYYNILLIREKFADTAIANPKVNELLSKYGYNQKTFQTESFELFEKDKALFTKMIDSVRRKAEQEVKIINQSDKKAE